MKLVVATGNPHKVREVREILASSGSSGSTGWTGSSGSSGSSGSTGSTGSSGSSGSTGSTGSSGSSGSSAGLPLEVLPLSDFTHHEPVEDGITFAENALIKARSASALAQLPALADDSGISVDVLGGAPGVFSARWCGRHGDDQANRDLLLAQLADVPPQHRGAAFVSAIALVLPDGREYTTHGRVDGTLTLHAQGTGGFGYDPIFIPRGHQQTTAQMSPEQKNSLSHRGIALREMLPILAEVLG